MTFACGDVYFLSFVLTGIDIYVWVPQGSLVWVVVVVDHTQAVTT